MAKIAIDMKGGELANIAPSINQDIVIGIDLGTTNSLVAYVNAQNNQAQIIAPTAATAATNETQQLVPSIIYFNPGSTEILVGIEAKPHLISNPENTIYSVKRLMGKSYADVQDLTNTLGYEIINDDTDRLVKIRVGNRFFTPIELSGLILQQLKQRAEEMLNLPVTKAVITVPAYFNDAQR
ncbi:MAG TPA: Hsp70 family protein, partial [Chitinophagales bacterium]|nr:Hsp70 family protein [Chitinophagales bacterium]